MTFGWLVGEMVRRVYGASVGRLVQREIAGPLGVDYFIGTPGRESRTPDGAATQDETPRAATLVNATYSSV